MRFASHRADVAESVDARVSEARESNLVEVQIFSSAPFLSQLEITDKQMGDEFAAALAEHGSTFNVDLDDAVVGRMSRYFELLVSSNELLHLVAPCSAKEFAVRHILESISVAGLLPKDSKLADVGSGAGLPGIPLAIYREDLKVVLIESKQKKAAFLNEAIDECGLSERVRTVNKQFAETACPAASVVTARALDRFTKVLPRFVRWAKGHDLILFGGPSMEEALNGIGIRFERQLIPMSEQRFVYLVRKG